MNNSSRWLMVAFLTLGATCVAHAQGPVVKDPNPKLVVYPDITCRPVLFFGGEYSYHPEGENFDPQANVEAFDKISHLPTMLKGARRVTPGQPLTLTKEDAFRVFTEKGIKYYHFNVGFHLLIKTPKGAAPWTSFNSDIWVYTGSMLKLFTVSSLTPVPGQEIEAVHSQVFLPAGESTVKLLIDHPDLIKESDEQNNVYIFKVIVKP